MAARTEWNPQTILCIDDFQKSSILFRTVRPHSESLILWEFLCVSVGPLVRPRGSVETEETALSEFQLSFKT